MRLILIMWLMIAGAALPAMAAEPFNTRGTWFVSWSGIPFAKCWMALEEDPDSYRLTASYKSRGLARLFDKTKNLTLSHGLRVGESMQELEYKHENDDEDKLTLLQFDLAGELVRRQVEPDDDPTHRPPVAATDIKGAVTPGNGLFALREAVRQAVANSDKSFSLRFYEGKRLMRINGTVAEQTSYEIDGKNHQTHKLILTRDLLGGFTDKEISRYKEGEPPLYLFLDAKTLFPLAMEIEIKFGTVKAVWKAE